MRIDHAALVRGHAEAGETVEIVGLGQVSVTTVKELMADAFIAAVVMKGHDVVNVAHLGRGVNAYQRTALEAVNVAIQIDHRTPWTQKAETVLAKVRVELLRTACSVVRLPWSGRRSLS